MRVLFRKRDEQPLVFGALGPYGFSLDVSPDEALANASAFVVPLHPKNGSHWAAFVRFAHVLEHPASSDPATRPERVSDLSDVHAIYTLPDSAIDLSDFFGPIVTGG